jgi:hypothetical protein
LPITVQGNDTVILNGSTVNQIDDKTGLRIQSRCLHGTLERRIVPVLQETLLLVELEMQESCIDLNVLSHLILNDLGATLEILRLVGREYGDAKGRPIRMVDCLADMGLKACLDTMSTGLISGPRRSKALAELSDHSREIARHAQSLAEETLGVDPDQAYLVGLCHAIGALPIVLGWNGLKSNSCFRADAGLNVAREWWLPRCVVDYFSEVDRCGRLYSWPEIVQAAHRLVGHPASESIANENLQTQLQRAV